MKSLFIPLLGLLGIAAANAQSKPGSISPLLFEATITTENAPQDVNLPAGAKRRVFNTSQVRLVNRDIIDQMRLGGLLDGTITGWNLARIADVAGVGNLYAFKAGKPAVAVPATLLTQITALGTATTGSTIIPATGAQRPNLIRKTYGSLNVRQGASTAAGTQILKFGSVKIGATTHVVATQIDNFGVTGKSGTGVGIVSGSYRTTKPLIANLTVLFPGATVP